MYAKIGALFFFGYIVFLTLSGLMGWGNHSSGGYEDGGSCISGRFKDDC